MNAELQKLLKEFVALGKKQDKLDKAVADLKDARDKVEQNLIMLFDAEKLQNLTLKGLGMFYISPSTFPKVEDEEKLHAWLKKNRLGALIKKKVVYQTLRGLVNERLKDNMTLPDGVTTYDKRTLVHKTK